MFPVGGSTVVERDRTSARACAAAADSVHTIFGGTDRR
jgi:hypothetical protein